MTQSNILYHPRCFNLLKQIFLVVGGGGGGWWVVVLRPIIVQSLAQAEQFLIFEYSLKFNVNVC